MESWDIEADDDVVPVGVTQTLPFKKVADSPLLFKYLSPLSKRVESIFQEHLDPLMNKKCIHSSTIQFINEYHVEMLRPLGLLGDDDIYICHNAQLFYELQIQVYILVFGHAALIYSTNITHILFICIIITNKN